jgi:hypothetical protein
VVSASKEDAQSSLVGVIALSKEWKYSLEVLIGEMEEADFYWKLLERSRHLLKEEKSSLEEEIASMEEVDLN